MSNQNNWGSAIDNMGDTSIGVTGTQGLAHPSGTRNDTCLITSEILISCLPYGYVVSMGCAKFAFSDSRTMLKNIQAYLDNPREVQAQWLETQKLPVK